MNKQSVQIGTKKTKEDLESKIKSLNLARIEEETEKKAKNTGITYIDLAKFPVSLDAIKLIEEDKAKSLKIICFYYTGEELRLGSTNPTNPQVTKFKDELAEKTHAKALLYTISEHGFARVFELYKKIPTILKIEGVSITEEDLKKYEEQLKDLKALNKLVNEADMTEGINIILAGSLKFGASDIHFETEKDATKIRLRIDGELHEAISLPKEDFTKIANRIKLLAHLKLNASVPQDGRITINLKDNDVDLRVSTMPSTWGESIVFRILKSSSISLKFEEMGIIGKAFNDLENEIKKPNGMIITTGPTGSGKTTTLYAILSKLNEPNTKIITLEDPVEYKLAGIVQSQVSSERVSEGGGGKNVYTFSKGLKAILRQDPDIVMVGEIRDLETAETAIDAALTGHMMLSTLHTNSAAGSIPRFLSMGVKPFLLAPSLNAVIGQRLARRLCDCKVEDKELDNKTLTIVMNALETISPESGQKIEDLSNLKFYKAKGCTKCNDIGFKGRVGVYEIMTMSPEIEKLILGGKVSEYEMQKAAENQGMVNMLQDGLIKALKGMTSVEEILAKIKN